MRNILSLILVFLMVLGLTACSKKGGENMENSGQEVNLSSSDTSSDEVSSSDTSSGSGTSTGTSTGSSSSQSGGSSSEEVQGIFAAERTVTSTGGVSAKRTLANTYKCLTEKKSLNVLYIGGSLTVGTGSSNTECWRAYTTSWLRSAYPNAQINETNSAVGGTGSLWGLARTKRDIIAHNPDLVFIEFAINDTYFGITEAQAASYMEGMVRQINTALPNCDIVFIITTDKSRLGKLYPTASGHIKVAKFYGIPYIEVGDALVKPVNNASWEEYATDIVHLNAKGYRIYADAVISKLTTLLGEAASKSAGAHTLPAGYSTSNPSLTVSLMEPDKIAALNSEQWTYRPNTAICYANKSSTLPKTDNATLKFEFDGTVMCVMGHKYPSGEVTFIVDGEVARVLAIGYEKDGEILAVDNLKPGHHTVEIKVTSKCLIADGFMVG